MVSSTAGLQSTNAASSFTLTSTSSTSSANSTDSFAQQLTSLLEGYLGKSQSGSQLDITISPVQGQSSDGSQFLVTVKTDDHAEAANAPASSSSSITADSQTASGSNSISSTPMTEYDAYWAAQPAAVQALRNMPDSPEKDEYALKLSQEGYPIDTQIMLWGWDPEITMTVRANEGYTWVPSFGQPNIPVGPGAAIPGFPVYDPNDPPKGSVTVSTAFANGSIHNVLLAGNSNSSNSSAASTSST